MSGKPFLYDYQMDAVNKMKNGCILNGGVGSGKSRTALFYYYKEQGGWIDENGFQYPKPPIRDLYIITTARKRDTLEWEGELSHILMSTKEDQFKRYGNHIIIDSWNNIKKYVNVYGAFFIFDEDRVTGYGAWVKTFLKIANKNKWIILSATPGDTWSDFMPVFIANKFYKNKTEFEAEHVIYSRYSKFPKIDRYVGTERLNREYREIMVNMDFKRNTVQHHENIYCIYDIMMYKKINKTRQNPFTNEPIKQISELCYVLRRVSNMSEDRQVKLLEILEHTDKAIIFYNFDYELEILKNLPYENGTIVSEWNGHKHEQIPKSNKWIYLVNYMSGAEGWNCIETDTIIFYSQNYSYKTMTQAAGRIDRLNTPFKDLYFYHLKSRSGIDLAISNSLSKKKDFNENHWYTRYL